MKDKITIIYDNGDFMLRNWMDSDIKSLAKNANDITVWNNVRDVFPSPYTEKDAEDYITFTKGKEYLQDFAIVIDGQAVGGIGFIPQTDVERFNAEVGYWLNFKYRKRGIMSIVLPVLVEYIFSNTDLIRLFALTFQSNKASMHLLEKVGFKKSAIFKNAVIKNGILMDFHYYDLLKEDFIRNL